MDFFGKKEIVLVSPSADAMRSLNERLITMQEEHIRNIDAYSDSIQLQNKELNRKPHMLINTLNNPYTKVFSVSGKTYQGITQTFHSNHNWIDYSHTHPIGNLLPDYPAGSEMRHEAQAENGGNNKQKPRTAGNTQEYHSYQRRHFNHPYLLKINALQKSILTDNDLATSELRIFAIFRITLKEHSSYLRK